MTTKLYQMPFRFDELMKRNHELPSCNPGTSIAQNIFLIISSKFNEHRYDADYGCEIWDKDFELITNTLVWQEQINRSIHNSLTHYEPRLENIEADTTIVEEPYQHPVTRIRSIKKKIVVRVKGIIKATGEPFTYSPQMYISPISID